MRVVHLYKDYYPPTVGGIEQTVERMALWTSRAGGDVTVLTSHPGVRRTLEERLDGVRVIRCAEFGRVWSTPFCPGMPSRLATLEADVFHLHFPSPPGELSWLLARPRGAMVVTWHSDIIRQRAALPVYGHVVRSLLEQADRVMPIFEGQAARSPFLSGVPGKLEVVGLGIDLDRYAVPAAATPRLAELRSRIGDGPVVLFIGRVVRSKGLEFLLESAPRVRARIVIVGDGPELGRLRARAARLGLDNQVHFAGRVDPDRIPEYVALATVGVLPSVYESYGLAMVEIMTNGVPIVCTELGTGTTFINLPGVTGLAVPPGQPGALADALNTLLADEPLRRQLGEGARDRARTHFSTDSMMSAVSAVYEAALARRSRD